MIPRAGLLVETLAHEGTLHKQLLTPSVVRIFIKDKHTSRIILVAKA